MAKVKTFTSELKILRTKHELDALDEEVNQFLAEDKARKVISVSDTSTAGDDGVTIGIIRILAYEEG